MTNFTFKRSLRLAAFFALVSLLIALPLSCYFGKIGLTANGQVILKNFNLNNNQAAVTINNAIAKLGQLPAMKRSNTDSKDVTLDRINGAVMWQKYHRLYDKSISSPTASILGYNTAHMLNSCSYPISVNSIAINPANNNIVYATGTNAGVYKSIDSGTTWKRLDSYLLSS